MPAILINHQELKRRVSQVFVSVGFPELHAQQAADVLVCADLRGVDSHGVARLPGYVRLVEAGRINPIPQFTWHGVMKAAQTLDADDGVGLVSGPFAMRKAIEIAKDYGVAAVGVRGSNHFGIAGYHARLASEAGLIGIAMTNASPLVVPFGGRERMLGTNPIAAAFPRQGQEDIVIDLSTSAAANGKLEIAARQGKRLPKGWAIDAEGAVSDDPKILQTGGALLPLGGDEDGGAHKGYALGAMVDLLSGVMTGANFGPFVPPFVAFLNPGKAVGKGIGHFFLAIHPEAFGPLDAYNEAIETWVSTFRSSKPVNEVTPVLVPGDPEMALTKERLEKGIPLEEQVYEGLLLLEGN
jgi:LDH2 family malate/lactate/ureidoglycolate dehydrogenase